MTTATGTTWNRTADVLPPEGETVWTLNGNQEVMLVRKGRLWFYPDYSLYVYYTPKYWRTVS